MKNRIPLFMLMAWLNVAPASAACDKSKAESTPSARFILKEGEAFDQKTKLFWSRCSLGTTWKKGAGCIGTPQLLRLDEAKRAAQKLGGNWRIPTIVELYSIVETRCSNPAINAEVFPGIKNLGEGAPFWSTSKIPDMPPLVYFVDFLSGEADGHTKGFSMAVRLVRSGQ